MQEITVQLSARVRSIPGWVWLLSCWLWVIAPGTAPARSAPPPDEDPLGEVLVEAGKSGSPFVRLPILVVESPLEETELTARTREIVTRDLELSGEFELLPAAHAVVRPRTPAEPVDPARWTETRAELVVRVHADRKPPGLAELRIEVHRVGRTDGPLVERTATVALSGQRMATHRLVDATIGALTGYEGPFASRLTFVRTVGGRRTVYVIDPDGHGITVESPESHLAVGPAFAPDGTLYWAASVDGGRYRLYRRGSSDPLAIEPRGSIYGIAFDDAGERAALSIATSRGIQVFSGRADFTELRPVTQLLLAMHPVFSSRGRLAYAGTAKRLQRIYVDGKAVSVRGASASAPAFCRHPDGTKLVYAAGVKDRADLVVTTPKGEAPIRITQGQGRNSSPTCSPDGRLVAFFSTRRTGEGPGLYVMRLDGRRPRKISSIVGDSLQWSRRLPAPAVADRAAPAAGPRPGAKTE